MENIYISVMPQNTNAYSEVFLDLKKCWVEVDPVSKEHAFIEPTPEQEIEAWSNTYHKAIITDLSKLLFGISDVKPVYIEKLVEKQLDKKQGLYVAMLNGGEALPGAGILAVSSLLYRIGVSFGTNYYIIPSSQRELIVFSEDILNSSSCKDMINTIKEVNDMKCVGDLKLSDSLYRYNLQEEKLEIVEI